MSYCLNPNCEKPQNIDGEKFCQTCGSKLLLRERYRAFKIIGQGGFGRTFLAVDEDKPSQPCCVIKQFLPQVQGANSAKKAAELFEQEAVRLDNLGKHSQIPELLAHFKQDSQLYLVQEFINGQNLAEELAEDGAFNETQIRDLLRNLLPVLQFVHEHQVIHRDIKPENIIRQRQDGQLVLVDFGAAKFATGMALLKTGTVIGTPQYTAPEQALGKADFVSDLYSLGVTCLHLLTQFHPFELFDTSENNWAWRNYLTTPVSDSLGQILDKMIQQATKRRYHSADEVLQDLNKHKIAVTPLPTSPSPTIPLKPVKIGNKYGYKDRTGQIVIQPQLQFDDVMEFSEGLAAVRIGGKLLGFEIGLGIGTKWGYIDQSGQVVIPLQFTSADLFSEGLAAVKIGFKWGYIDQLGQVVIQPEFASANLFSEGLAAVKIGFEWGYIDQLGRMVIQPQFNWTSRFRNGLARVKIGEQEHQIDKSGKFIY